MTQPSFLPRAGETGIDTLALSSLPSVDALLNHPELQPAIGAHGRGLRQRDGDQGELLGTLDQHSQCLPLGVCSATIFTALEVAKTERDGAPRSNLRGMNTLAMPAAGRLQRDNYRAPHHECRLPPRNACRWAPAARLGQAL